MIHYSYLQFLCRLFYKGDDGDDDDDDDDSDNVVKYRGKFMQRLMDNFTTGGSAAPSPLPPPPPPPQAPPHLMMVGPGDCTLPRPRSLTGIKRGQFEAGLARNTWINKLQNGRLSNENTG